MIKSFSLETTLNMWLPFAYLILLGERVISLLLRLMTLSCIILHDVWSLMSVMLWYNQGRWWQRLGCSIHFCSIFLLLIMWIHAFIARSLKACNRWHFKFLIIWSRTMVIYTSNRRHAYSASVAVLGVIDCVKTIIVIFTPRLLSTVLWRIIPTRRLVDYGKILALEVFPIWILLVLDLWIPLLLSILLNLNLKIGWWRQFHAPIRAKTRHLAGGLLLFSIVRISRACSLCLLICILSLMDFPLWWLHCVHFCCDFAAIFQWILMGTFFEDNNAFRNILAIEQELLFDALHLRLESSLASSCGLGWCLFVMSNYLNTNSTTWSYIWDAQLIS